MFIQLDEKTKKSMQKDGSCLKYFRSIGGIGMGLIALGAYLGGFVLVFGIFIGIMMDFLGLIPMAAGAGIVIAIVFCIPGYLLHKKKVDNYRNYYAKEVGYTPEKLDEFDREFAQGEVWLCTEERKLNKEAKVRGSLLMDKWCRLHTLPPLLATDICAIWWEKMPFFQGIQRDDSCFVLDANGAIYILTGKAEVAEILTREISKRNPRLITTRKFSYNGQNYDARNQTEEVAALYRSVCGRK